MIRTVLKSVGSRIFSVAPGDSVEEAAKQGAFKAASHLGGRIPQAIRAKVPDLSMTTMGWVVVLEGGTLTVSALDPTEAPRDSASIDESDSGFWQSLPKGVKTGIEEIDGDSDVREELPSNEGDVRSLIQRLRDTIEGLDDVDAYDVVEAVDSDMYDLWRELERKMQTHKRSEAKHQLKGMFDI